MSTLVCEAEGCTNTFEPNARCRYGGGRPQRFCSKLCRDRSYRKTHKAEFQVRQIAWDQAHRAERLAYYYAHKDSLNTKRSIRDADRIIAKYQEQLRLVAEGHTVEEARRLV